MGSWDTDPFGNDSAVDWAEKLEEFNDLTLVKDAIHAIHNVGAGYIEAPDAEEAIAAADLLARLKGKFYARNVYTESIDTWVEKHKVEPPEEVVTLAIKAIDRILTPPSELLELWQGSTEFDSWRNHLLDLKVRLE